jgi:acylphosphatase
MAQRAFVIYNGDVQGVGFRYTARQVAASYPITGYVKNLTDGGVELVAEGEPADVEAFLTEIDRRMAPGIATREIRREPAAGGLTGFTIRYM